MAEGLGAIYGREVYGLLAYGSASSSEAAPASAIAIAPGTIQSFDFSVNLLQAILWEYNNSTNLVGLLSLKAAWYDTNQTEFWQDWSTNVFNLETADQFGLIVWSIILGFPVYINSGAPSGPFFGFNGSGNVNFDNGILAAPNGSSTTYSLETQRVALRLRAYQIASSGTVPEINRALADIFSSYGTAYLIDYHDMTQSYYFNFKVPADMAQLFNNTDILPRPAGVGSTWIDSSQTYFGFNGSGGVNFDNGILAP
jgi:hypothetical protein